MISYVIELYLPFCCFTFSTTKWKQQQNLPHKVVPRIKWYNVCDTKNISIIITTIFVDGLSPLQIAVVSLEYNLDLSRECLNL